MKLRTLCGIGLAGALFLTLVSATRVQGSTYTEPQIRPTNPTPAASEVSEHKPYEPLEQRETLALYPPEPTISELRPHAPLSKPPGVDLDVTYISRSPMYSRYEVWYTHDGKPYLRPGTENDQRWPQHGEVVTFTAHVMNKGTVASGPFDVRWLIDGVEVASGTHPSLYPGDKTTETYQWIWPHTVVSERLQGEHTVAFEVDPGDKIAETYKSNNVLEDRTDAISLVLALTPELYEALETPVDPEWPFSAEDWLQKQIAAMNAAFARSVYPSAPNGVEERVRLDKILVTSSHPPTDWSRDGGFYMWGDDRYGNAYYDPSTDVSGALIHELTHQLGIIDVYNLDVPLEVPQVLDRRGRPVQMEFWASALLPGLMGNPGILPLIYDEHSTLALNANKGYRRGYYGEYLYDVPDQTCISVVDSEGKPAAGTRVDFYQRASSPNMRGSKHGVIDNTPEISVVTDEAGLALLPNRPIGNPIFTRTGHTLRDNPLGVVDVVGKNGNFMLRIAKGSHEEFQWLDVTRFNLVVWRGDSTLTLVTQVPPDDAPTPPLALAGVQERGQVRLRWQPSPSSTTSEYNVYRTDGPAYTYKRIVTRTTALSYDDSYDYTARAAGYAVTAVDETGRESGFSDLFWALRLRNPADIVVDDSNERIVLDPQNGYALLIQSSDGHYLDTMGSFDLHLEYSRYLDRDPAGNLIISHPGDYYSTRHSVRVTDREANLLFEFGDRGSGPGQFEKPSGVAFWGELCTIEGPWASDPHTLLLAHFDKTCEGEGGEACEGIGTSFVPGRFGEGILITDTATLTYEAPGNFDPQQGAIEFWFQPRWSGQDGAFRVFLEIYDGPPGNPQAPSNQFLLWSDYFWDGQIPVFYMSNSSRSTRAGYWTPPWNAGDWHHLAVTWQAGEKMRLYLDGMTTYVESDAKTPVLDVVGEVIRIGFGTPWYGGSQIGGVIDELRISDIPRVGNSDTCSYRILVADSGNHRIQAFDAQGNFVSAFGAFGDGPGEFSDPQGLAVLDNDEVVVVDRGNDRLQVLAFDGSTFSFAREIAAEFDGPTDVAAYGSHHLVVADTGNDSVKVLDSEGSLLHEYGAPNDGFAGPFDEPQGVTADRSARIVVADTGNRRVVTILNALPVRPPSRVVITGPTIGASGADQRFIAAVDPLTVTVPLTYTWHATGHEPVIHTSLLSDTVSFSWATSGPKTVTLTTRNAGGAATATHTITVFEPATVYLPLVVRNY